MKKCLLVLTLLASAQICAMDGQKPVQTPKKGLVATLWAKTAVPVWGWTGGLAWNWAGAPIWNRTAVPVWHKTCDLYDWSKTTWKTGQVKVTVPQPPAFNLRKTSRNVFLGAGAVYLATVMAKKK